MASRSVGGKACGAGIAQLLHSQNEVNHVRQNISLKPFPPHKTDDSDDFRESRMRKMRELRERDRKEKKIKSE